MRTLICLECSALILVLSIILFKGTAIAKLPFLMLIILTFSACEGAIGLSLLVTNIRSIGTEYINLLNIFKC